MLFAEGNRVRFIHTGDQGVITELLGNDMVNVRLDDGFEIPASLGDFVVLSDTDKAPEVHYGKVKAKPTPKKQNRFYHKKKTTNKGILLLFEANFNHEGMVDDYTIMLANDTDSDAIYSLKMKVHGDLILDLNDKIPAISAIEIGKLLYDELNDSPTFDMQFWRSTTAGTEQLPDKTIKVKAKQFFKKVKTAPIIDRTAHVFEIFREIKKTAEKNSTEEDLKNYAKRTAETRVTEDMYNAFYEVNDVKERVEFSDEIDLHVEKLTGDSIGMRPHAKLKLQLDAFEKFLDRAIEVGLPKVFVIHGVGKGRLRNDVANLLLKHPDVKTFKNEHHPKYGFGATEVFLK